MYKRQALGLAATGLLVPASLAPASANADSCTYISIPYDYVCGSITGSGLNVRSATVSRGKFPGGSIKDYRAEARFTYPNGSSTTIISSTHYGKSYVRASRTINVNLTFPQGTRACLSFFESGSLQDTVCFTIKK